MQALFFCMIPLGILILIFSIRLLQKAFSGEIILEIPYSQKSAELMISKSGYYSIWHKGQFFRKAPLDEFRPEITRQIDWRENQAFLSVVKAKHKQWQNSKDGTFSFFCTGREI